MFYKFGTKAINWPLIAGIMLYFTIFALLSLGKHYSMYIGSYDMGVFTHSFWNALYGQSFFFNNMENVSHFAIHWSPTLLVILPVFALYPKADTLIVLQTLALSLGALPLYHIAARRYGHAVGLVFVTLYFLYTPLHGVNYWEFHEITFTVPFYLSALYFYERQSPAGMWIMLALALGCKEDQGLVVMMMGIAMMLDFRNLRQNRSFGMAHGLACFAVGVLSFIIVTRMILPAFGGTLQDAFNRYAYLGKNLPAIILSPILKPGAFFPALFTLVNFSYLLELLVPLALLPLTSVWFVPVLPPLLMNMLSAFGGMHITNSHYASALIPFLFYAAVRGLEPCYARMKSRQPQLAVPGVLKISLVLSMLFVLLLDPTPVRLGRHLPIPGARSSQALRLIREVPAAVSLSTQADLYPHVCNRRNVYPKYHPGADYILLDSANTTLIQEGGFEELLHDHSWKKDYLLLKATGPFMLLVKKSVNSAP